MDVFEMFALSIEVNIAIAGFAGIISAFRFQDRSQLRRGPVAALTVVVQLSLITALCACLPMLLHAFKLPESTNWLVCSILAVPIGFGLMYLNYLNMKPALEKKRYRLVHALVQLVCFASIVSNAMNAAGFIFQREPGPLLFMAIVGSAVSGLMFVRLLLIPLWIAVRENETWEAQSDVAS